MREPLAPLEQEPVSVHAPFISHPGGQYRHECAGERQVALRAALAGVAPGAYDERIVHWLAADEVATVATVVSLLWRTRHAATHQSHRGGGEPR
ncbi:MAG: hypothetical protein ACRD0H_08250 [Actinomycetes bacterium]